MADVDRFRDFLNGVEIVGYLKQSTDLAQLHTLIERHPDAVAGFIVQLGPT